MKGQNRLLIAELRGRLGNQLFIFASMYALAKKLGAELAFHPGPNLAREPHDLLLPLLTGTQHYRRATPQELIRVGRMSHGRGPYINPIGWPKIIAQTIISNVQNSKPSLYEESVPWKYDATLMEIALPAYVRGRFQSEKYFFDHNSEIYSILTQSSQLVPISDEIKRPIVSVSFRRGDYNSLGHTLSLQYYEEAIAYMEQATEIGTLIFFGDDYEFIELAVDRWSRKYPSLNGLDFGKDPITSLRTIEMADHCIVANSTLAWWGAWLGDQMHKDPTRIVIAPNGWIKGNSYDLIPERWVQI